MDTGHCGGEPFALRVLGSSMEPEFSEGHIVIIDPSAIVYDGCFVMVKIDDQYELRQMHEVEGGWKVSLLDGSAPDVIIHSLDDVAGMVVQRAGRKRQVKHYV